MDAYRVGHSVRAGEEHEAHSMSLKSRLSLDPRHGSRRGPSLSARAGSALRRWQRGKDSDCCEPRALSVEL
eukprot:487286-Pleurochrysis_carterae.AAC.2